MAIDYPNSPSTGDHHTHGGKTWTFHDGKWAINVASEGVRGPAGVAFQGTAPATTDVLWADTSTSGVAVLPIGGTTGQMLTKASSTSYDAVWATPVTSGDLALKAPLASPTFTGTPTLPTGTVATTQTAADSTTAIATTAFVTTADNLKANLASPTFTGTVSGVTKSMVGLGSVDNTADSAKPVSTAQQTALDLKAPLVSPSFTTPSLGVATATSVNGTTVPSSKTLVVTTDKLSALAATTSTELAGVISDETGSGSLVFANSPALVTPTGIVKNDVGLGNVDNTSDANKPVSSAQQTALNLKANLASPTFTGTVTVPTPVNATDAVTKSYADAIKQSLDIKDSVRVASTANIVIASALINGSTIDGVVVATGDRVLLKNQTAGAENGIYVVVASGASSRSTDADTSAKVTSGMYVFVSEGTVSADMGYVLTTNDSITLGTTSLAFTQFSGAGQITAGTGLSKSGNTLSIDTAVTADLSTAQTFTNKTLTSPTLTTPVLGVATGTSFNSITGLSSTTPIVDGTAAVGTGTTTARGDHVHPTDTSRAATSGTLAQFAATTSAQLLGVISDETGSGALVFGTSPTIATPNMTRPVITAQGGNEGGEINLASPVTGTSISGGLNIDLVSNSLRLFEAGGTNRGLAIDVTTLSAGAGSLIVTTDTTQTLTNKTLTSPTLTATPTAPTAAVGTNTTQLATTEFVTTAIPVGVINPYGGSSAPTGWLLCYGQAVSRTTYAALFAVLSTTYNTGGEAGTDFRLPDLRGRTVAGIDNMGGVDAVRLDIANSSGTVVGSQYVTLTSAEMPSHTHTQDAHSHSGTATEPATTSFMRVVAAVGTNLEANHMAGRGSASHADYTNATMPQHSHNLSINSNTAINQNTGGGGSHNNMQPTMVLNYIIKA